VATVQSHPHWVDSISNLLCERDSIIVIALFKMQTYTYKNPFQCHLSWHHTNHQTLNMLPWATERWPKWPHRSNLKETRGFQVKPGVLPKHVLIPRVSIYTRTIVRVSKLRVHVTCIPPFSASISFTSLSQAGSPTNPTSLNRNNKHWHLDPGNA